ncbi:putative Nop domain-containing protein [Medicago truncatula]|uniref:NOP56-like pre RNA processing ribonucleoprotein n=1 Tax=Medicago truncatula TaxID=3880 RepID=G7KC30_MEDTR|nr:probable nucleolar protein 5-2 [Medicago truncatula]AES94046.1 NOP56-like pre RNA processing ribonucleoprotein [Medicago truncatula]RHN53588.1 putative Nop domain-containing protein [Medicago truncatula]
MLVLFETPAGFALFKVLNEGKLSEVQDLWKEFSSADAARKVVKLKGFQKFENISEATEAASLLIDGKASKGLRKFLRAHCDNETLAVADTKLGTIIKEKLKIDCVHSNAVMEIMRGIRYQLTELITGLAVQDMAPMSLGLSHSLSRYKLKFSADKVDTMIVQAIGLLDDLDKELNTYAMRVREWYGWHFPELTKIIQDNIQYARSVKLMGDRINAAKLDFSEILTEEVEAELKEAAVISMGTEIGELDLANIRELCDQVLSLSEYRAQLYDYLKSRMNTIAPNLTAMVGELVGARLIAHGGSLINLAKQPGSTVQILGAEKALFRALKTKHATPKYGLIYHASLIGQAAPKFKGKISRSLAAKTALAIRCDALGDGQDNTMGLENRAKLEARLRNLEGKELGRFAGSAKGKPKIEAYDKDRKKGAGGLITPAKTYNTAADSIIDKKSDSAMDEDTEELSAADKKKEKKEKKKKEKKEEEDTQKSNTAMDEDTQEPSAADKKKEKKEKKEKKKKEKKEEADVDGDKEPEHEVVKKEKKKRKEPTENTEVENRDTDLNGGEKKKKRKKSSEPEDAADMPSKKKEKRKKKNAD